MRGELQRHQFLKLWNTLTYSELQCSVFVSVRFASTLNRSQRSSWSPNQRQTTGPLRHRDDWKQFWKPKAKRNQIHVLFTSVIIYVPAFCELIWYNSLQDITGTSFNSMFFSSTEPMRPSPDGFLRSDHGLAGLQTSSTGRGAHLFRGALGTNWDIRHLSSSGPQISMLSSPYYNLRFLNALPEIVSVCFSLQSSFLVISVVGLAARRYCQESCNDIQWYTWHLTAAPSVAQRHRKVARKGCEFMFSQRLWKIPF